jgi:L-gulono-1,4-lactone dehydrogenase
MTFVWRNHAGNQECTADELRQPKSIDELAEIVIEAERREITVRAVGAGHSWSDVALTRGIVVDPTHLGGVQDADDGTLLPRPPGAAPLVRVLGGTHIHRLNEELRQRDLALINMGGYDGQTIAGVISTSTHGSGLRFGPFPDIVRSLDLVIAGGQKVRVEPSTPAVSDKAAFERERPDWQLIQDDDHFFSVVCGMGTLGLVHSFLIEVRDAFWLDERRELHAWKEIRTSLTPQGALGHQHYELFLNPYKDKDGSYPVLVTTRTPCQRPADGESPGRGLQHPLRELESKWWLTGMILRFLARHLPRFVASRFNAVLEEMQDPSYRSISYKVFNIGEANHLPAISMELAVPVEGDRHVRAVDKMLEIAEDWAGTGIYHTSPIALRFVAPSKAWASMMFDRPTMMIELILITGTKGSAELLRSYEDGLGDDVRPHWGQINELTPERVRVLYPRWDTWLATAARFNASGVFDSPFTRRVGIP